MNKVFLDPNTKYSDQYAMLAKLPEVVGVVNETAEELAELVDQGLASLFICNLTYDETTDAYRCDKSIAEINSAFENGNLPILVDGFDNIGACYMFAGGGEYEGELFVRFTGVNGNSLYNSVEVINVNGYTVSDNDDWSVDASNCMIPPYTSSDANKVLTVNSNGTGVEWAQASGGGQMFDIHQVTGTAPIPSDIPQAPAGFTWVNSATYYLTRHNSETPLTLEEIRAIQPNSALFVYELMSDYYYVIPVTKFDAMYLSDPVDQDDEATILFTCYIPQDWIDVGYGLYLNTSGIE